MYLPIDRRREFHLGIGAWPERSVLVVDREDGDRGARAHVESAGDGQEFGGEMTIGQLRHRHVGRQARAGGRARTTPARRQRGAAY